MDFGADDSNVTDQTVGGAQSVASLVNPYEQQPAPVDVETGGGAPRAAAPFTYDPNSPGPVSSDGVPLLPLLRRLEGSGDDAVSPAGAIGRYQVVPRYWPQFDAGRLKDPAYNTAAATYIVGKLNDQYNGDADLVAIGYNGGPREVQKYLAAGRDPSVLPHETQAYLAHARELMGSATPTPSASGPAFGGNDTAPAFGAQDSAAPPPFGQGDSAPAAPAKPGVVEEAGRLGGSLLGGVVEGAGNVIHAAQTFGAGIQAADIERDYKAVESGDAAAAGWTQAQQNAAVLAYRRLQATGAGPEPHPRAQAAISSAAAATTSAGEAISPTNRHGLESVLHGAGEVVPALAFGAADSLAGAAVFGAQGYDEAAQEAARAGKTPAQQRQAGMENAGVQAEVGLIPFAKPLEPFVKGITHPIAAAIAKAGVHSAGDAAMMGTMQAGSNVVAEQNYDPNRPVTQGVGTAALTGALAGAAIHGGREAFNAATGRLRPAEAAPGPNGEAPTTPMPATDAIEKYIGDRQNNVPENVPLAAEPAQSPAELPPETQAKTTADATTSAELPRETAELSPPISPAVDAVASDVPAPILGQAAADVDEYRAAAPKGYSLFSAIKDLGGMRVKEADGSATAGPDVQGALEDVKRKPPGMINNKAGMSPEQMQEALADRGWLPADDPEALVNALQKEGSGEKVYHPDADTPALEARRHVLDHEMTEAGVSPTDTPDLAAAKLAAWRYGEINRGSTQFEALRARADDLGVEHDRDTSYSDLLGDVIEREALAEEAGHDEYDLEGREHDVHGQLTEADLGRLDALAAEGPPHEHGEGAAAYPIPEGGEPGASFGEADSESSAGSGGDREDEASPASEALALEEPPKLARKSERPGAGLPEPRVHPAVTRTPAEADSITPKERRLMAKVDAEIERIAPFSEVRPYRTIGERLPDGEEINALGMYHRDRLRHIISYALEGGDGVRVARHEAIHALKATGVIKPEEWDALSHAAVSEGWIEKYRIPERYGELTHEEQIEEAIAEHFASWKRQGLKGAPSFVNEAFARIQQFLAHVADLARQVMGRGVTADDVLSRIERGETGARPLGGDEVAQPKFARKPIDEETKGTPGIVNRILGHGAEAAGRKLVAAADRAIPDPVAELLDQGKMAISPMGTGSARAQASAKDFANALRQAAFQWGKMDEWLAKTYTPEERRLMWEAADEHGVLLRRGVEPGAGQGLNRLTEAQRGTVEAIQARADTTFKHAQDLGMVTGEGLESYVPRMVVEMTSAGPKVVSRATPKQAKRGANLSTTTGQLRQRKYETVEETEGAARKAFGEGATVVRDIRTLALATQRLEQAVAGRTLVDKIKAMSKDAGGGPLVAEGANPDPNGYFTMEGHPALTQWAPKMVKDAETGKWAPAIDQNGDPVFEANPLWISKEFEGPLKAVLSTPSSGMTRALMNLKAKMMSVIMYSPLMHNAVIWGKAIPADPLGVLTLQAYRRGNLARKDTPTMLEAIGAGMDPIGHRYFMQDIAGIAAAEGLDMQPGRSWTSQTLAFVPGLFDREAGEAVKRAVDKFGDVWHNTFLWDRIADLQAGLYVHIRDGLLAKGVDELSAQRTAAHFANRYAGALPMEGMSKAARNIANIMLFSRSFTLGNMAAYKDMVMGLPSDVRAQITRDGGLKALEGVQGVARQKAVGMLVLDVALQFAGLTMASLATAWLTHETVQFPWQNEVGKQNRFLIGYQPDGTAIYGRLPTGKVAEDLTDWALSPRETLLRKLSPYGRLMYEMASNDKGFGQHLYDPFDHSPLGLARNIGRVTWEFMGGIAPLGQIQGFQAMLSGGQDKKTAALQALAPFTGLTISKGAPGGPAQADLYAAADEQKFRWNEARPAVVQQIKQGDIVGARAKMTALGVPPGLQGYEIRVALNPKLRMSARQVRDFLMYATPEQKAQFDTDRSAQQQRAAGQP